MIVGSTRDDAKAQLHHPPGHGGCVGYEHSLVLAELVRQGLLGGDDVHQRAALDPGKQRSIDTLGKFLLAHDQPTARPTQGLVRGGSDELAVRNGGRVESGYHQSGDMCDIRHQQGSRLVGDLAKALEVENTAVGAGTANDQLGSVLTGDGGHLVVVNGLGFWVDPVRNDLEITPRVGESVSVGQVTTACQIHAHQGVPGLENREVDGHVGLSAAVRLDVDVLGAEQLPGALDRQALSHIHILAPTVIPPPRVTFGILVRHHAASSLEDRLADEVLGGNQFDGLVLSPAFVGDGSIDFRVGRW